MPTRRQGVKLPGITAYVDNVSTEVIQEAAEEIVQELRARGPYWTGLFESNWIVKYGTQIARSSGGPTRSAFMSEAGSRPNPYRPVNVPKINPRAKGFGYTIFNQTPYANIAMDLTPSGSKAPTGDWRFGPTKNNTAEQDWFLRYVELPDGLKATLANATRRVSDSDFRIKGYKTAAGRQRYRYITGDF